MKGTDESYTVTDSGKELQRNCIKHQRSQYCYTGWAHTTISVLFRLETTLSEIEKENHTARWWEVTNPEYIETKTTFCERNKGRCLW